MVSTKSCVGGSRKNKTRPHDTIKRRRVIQATEISHYALIRRKCPYV